MSDQLVVVRVEAEGVIRQQAHITFRSPECHAHLRRPAPASMQS